jgi:type V secretory pathway adhesin AidA
MASGKLGVEYKKTLLANITSAATLYLALLETVVDFTEDGYGELDVTADIALTSVAAKFNAAPTNPSGSLVRVANDAVIITAAASAGGAVLTGWALLTTNVPSTAEIVALQNFATAVTTVVGLTEQFAIGDLKVELD